MSCYFRILKDVFDAAGVEITKANRTAADLAIHDLPGLATTHCPTAGRACKAQAGTDPTARAAFAKKLARKLTT